MTRSMEREIDLHALDSDESFIERLGERLGMRAHASTVYGEPVERDGVTVVPVAKVRYGFGGGGGKKEGEKGGGGGGGINVIPVGYIELRDGGSEFRPITDPQAKLRLAMAGLFLGALVFGRFIKMLRS